MLLVARIGSLTFESVIFGAIRLSHRFFDRSFYFFVWLRTHEFMSVRLPYILTPHFSVTENTTCRGIFFYHSVAYDNIIEKWATCFR